MVQRKLGVNAHVRNIPSPRCGPCSNKARIPGKGRHGARCPVWTVRSAAPAVGYALLPGAVSDLAMSSQPEHIRSAQYDLPSRDTVSLLRTVRYPRKVRPSALVWSNSCLFLSALLTFFSWQNRQFTGPYDRQCDTRSLVHFRGPILPVIANHARRW
jgi:hypothetical protein